MKRAFIILLFIVTNISVYSQNAKVKNVDVDIDKNKIYVSYDLLATDTTDNHIELFFVDDRFTVKVPEKLSGDIGNNVEPGLNRRIEWDIFHDDVEIAQKLQPKIVVNGIKKGGPKNALYSILIPGLGDYFVKDHKDMIIKPYYRTLFTLGTVGLGVMALQNREMVPMYSEKYDRATNSMKTIVIGTERKNWLFENDAEIFLATGIAMWIGDIVWVYAKGSENEKLKMFSNFSLNGYTQSGYTNLSLTYTF